MKSTLICNARLVSPGVELDDAYILIEDGRIAAVLNGKPARFTGEKIHANGNYVMPGFIDVHCHGRNNFDFCDGSEEGTALIARSKLAEGVTTLLPTTLTLPENDLVRALTAVRQAAALPDGCRIPGVHLEGPFINPKCAGAQNTAFVRPPDLEEVARLDAVFKVLKVTFAVEMPGASELTAGLLRRGIVPSCTHSAATYADFRAACDAGLRNLSHFCNQMSPLHHRDIGLVGGGLLNREVYVELICDRLHISPPMIQLVFAVKGCDRVILITDAMRAAGMPDGDYSLGGLPVVVADGAARLRDGGALAGSTLQLATALRNVHEVTGLPLCELVKAAGWNAARSLGLRDVGRIEPGYLADLVILNSSFTVLKTLVGGEIRYAL